MRTSPFDAGALHGDEWMCRVIWEFGLDRADVMLEDKCQELLQSDHGSPQERDGFIHGMKEALLAAKLSPERFREVTPNDDET
jgi:hypothetical protein